MNQQRGLAPTAPLKGVFPLDHDGECKPVMKRYLDCIRDHRSAHALCNDLSKAYLACRMDRGLMQHEDLRDIGFDDASTTSARRSFRADGSEGAASSAASAAAAAGGAGAAAATTAAATAAPADIDPRTGRPRRRRREIVAGVEAAKKRKPGIGWG
uniref:CHCH domain-containing protein n=1 Tax=Bicosoecida sp. CB-2014 TaxID=1486930 RepID=A0A7S1CGD2_9STRA|mmetsp:Transcript_25824/g.89927  ORF Transcript_25824/g.89927 Transcript_25824/m.89927 type:complete len:156 (+) Transcript_25824:202-669(+)